MLAVTMMYPFFLFLLFITNTFWPLLEENCSSDVGLLHAGYPQDCRHLGPSALVPLTVQNIYNFNINFKENISLDTKS